MDVRTSNFTQQSRFIFKCHVNCLYLLSHLQFLLSSQLSVDGNEANPLRISFWSTETYLRYSNYCLVNYRKTYCLRVNYLTESNQHSYSLYLANSLLHLKVRAAEQNINDLKDQFYMLGTPNLAFIDGNLSHKVTVFIHDANWEKQWNTFLGERRYVSR